MTNDNNELVYHNQQPAQQPPSTPPSGLGRIGFFEHGFERDGVCPRQEGNHHPNGRTWTRDDYLSSDGECSGDENTHPVTPRTPQTP